MEWDMSESRWNLPLTDNGRDISRSLEIVGWKVHGHAKVIKELIIMTKG
jgi:hypothetical protein